MYENFNKKLKALHQLFVSKSFNEWFCDKCDKFKITIIGEIVDHALYGC